MAVAALLCVGAAAQPKSLGFRTGLSGLRFTGEVSYEHWIGALGEQRDFVEAEVGLYGMDGFRATGLYNYVFFSPRISERSSLAFYAGPGLMFGYGSLIDPEDPASFTGTPFAGACAQVGGEYTFPFGLQLGLDFRPTFFLPMGLNDRTGWLGAALSVRYAF